MRIFNRFSSPSEFQPLPPFPKGSSGNSYAHVYNVMPVPVKLYDWEKEYPELVAPENEDTHAYHKEYLAPVVGSIGLDGIRIDDPRTVVNFIQEAPRGFEPTSEKRIQ